MQKGAGEEILLHFCPPEGYTGSLPVYVYSVMSYSVTPRTVAHRLSCSWNFPGENTGVGCHFLFQVVFLTQGSNLHLLSLLHWQADSLPLSYLGSPWLCIHKFNVMQILEIWTKYTSYFHLLWVPCFSQTSKILCTERDTGPMNNDYWLTIP